MWAMFVIFEKVKFLVIQKFKEKTFHQVVQATRTQLAGEEYTRQINPSFSELQCLLDSFTM